MADKKVGGYDLEGARKAEISDEESLQHLAKLHNYDLSGARDAGISDTESLSHLAALPAPAAEVVEKESPEVFGGLTGAAGAVTAAGDVLFSKGRPLFRAAEKMVGLPQDPNLAPSKQRKFLDPAQVTERAIARREALMAPTATESYMGSGQFTSPEGKPLYYGTGETGEYSGARKAAARAIETEKMFPGIKVLPGETPIALPEGVTSQVQAERAEAQRLKDIEQQKEISQIGQRRAKLLDERNRLARLKGGLGGAETLGSKVAAPILGGYELGSQGAQAYNRLTREDLQPSDIAAGATNIAGAGAGAASMLPGRLRLPKAVISTGLGRVADILDVRNPRKEKSVLEEKAKGGLVHLAKGKAVKKLSEVLVPHEGKTLLGTMADRTKATEGFSGGPGFINLHPEYTWAVDAPGAATRHMRMIEAAGGPERTVVAPMLMSKQAHKSNRPVFEKMYKDLVEDIKSGKVTPEQIAALQKRMSIEKTLQGVPNIADKEFLDFANAFHRRGTIADIMGQKRIGAVDLQKHLDETIDPALRESELGAIGPQLFTMESQQLKPDVHPGYRYVFSGEKGQDQFTPVPREFLFRDLESKAIKELGRPLSDYNYRTSVGIPTQKIDEKLLRQLQDLGYAKGGRIAKATRDLILPPAENAARTQRINTIPTYQKAGEMFNQRGATGQALDFSAGLGEGAKFLGPNTLTYEPFAQGWKPTFSRASEIPSEAFGKVANLNSLNVVPRETRDEMVLDIGRAMERGGHGIITTRGPEVMTARGIPGPEPTSIITSSDTYQKGFTKQELEDYLRYMLGEGYDVNRIKLGPAGAYIQKKAGGGKIGALESLAKKLLPAAEREANKAKFLEGNHPAVPNVVYHATRAAPKGEAINQLIGSKSGSLGSGTYTTPNAKFGSTYTGIPTPETIEELKTSFPAMAKPFVKGMEEGDWSGVPMGGYMMPLHPSVKNPLILEGTHADPAYEALAKLGVPDSKIDKIVEKANEKYGSIGKEIQSRAQKAGHDAVILYKNGDIQEMVTYSPYQLKSATGNEGTFNPYDPRLSKKEGGSTTPAWQRKEGKNPEGGLNALGRASYNRETGGNLKAPQPEGGSRKKSFCARMGGMKKKLTSSKTANDPDSRINKALRKWKC